MSTTPLKVFVYDNYARGTTSSKFDGLLTAVNKYQQGRAPRLTFVATMQEAQVICCHYVDVEVYIACRGKRSKKAVIVCERFDAATLNEAYLHYEHRIVAAVFKDFTLRDWTAAHDNQVHGRFHFALINDGKQAPNGRKNVNPRYARRLVPCVWGLDQYSHSRSKRDMQVAYEHGQDRDTVRDIDVFAVFHDHKEHPVLYQHRVRLRALVREICQRRGWTAQVAACEKQDFLRQMRRSKVVVAPYGIGTRIASDQFAVWSGCVLVKPKSDFLVTVPDWYGQEKYMVSCDPTWSDLEDKLAAVLADLPTFQKRTRAAAELFEQWTDDEYARDFVDKTSDCYRAWLTETAGAG